MHYTFFFCILLYIGFGLTNSIKNDDNKTWWKTANYYQIYPKSFQDSDGDGIGDINGITSRLQYFNEIGIGATWLSPIFTSPMIDNGYDISNFMEIDPIFGTLDDFKKLVAKAHELKIKVLLDFVPNHSSDQHEWFKKSVAGDPKYKDYYIWANGKKDENNESIILPPNNWRSVFRGSAWTWNEQRKQFYYHQFYKEQPDLNFRNEDVKKEMANILTYWLDLGVDGYRIDAVPHIIEDDKLRDEPKSGADDPEDYNYLIHDYTYDQNLTFEMIYEWREVLDNYTLAKGGSDRVLLAEAYSPMDKKMKYYGNGNRKGAQFPFNFLLLDLNQKSNASEYVAKVTEWLTKMPAQETANWVFGNHDKPRIANTLGRQRTTLANMFILSLPGITVTYYGEEIGMENIELEKPFYMEDVRDAERSPMQWDDGVSAGFSKNITPWLPIAEDYKTRNVKVQRRVPLGHLNLYKQMAKLRREYKFYEASGFKISNTNNIIKIESDNTGAKIEIFFNVGNTSLTIEIKKVSIILLMNEHSLRRLGEKLTPGQHNLHSNEVMVLKLEE